jgi:hypothetical protein
VKVYRCFAWNERVADTAPDGPLWFPRPWQGDGRHDNPDLYGCLYLSEHPAAAVVEQLARFRGARLTPALFRRRSLPLALADIDGLDADRLVDLDDPVVLRRARLRPSVVATRERSRTQAQARDLYEHHADASGLRWWSTFESLWINVTLFDRVVPTLRAATVRVLELDDAVVVQAADFLGLQRS